MALGDKSADVSKMTLRQEISTDKYANQTLSHVNPSLTDDKFVYFAGKINALTEKTLDRAIRTDTFTVAVS